MRGKERRNLVGAIEDGGDHGTSWVALDPVLGEQFDWFGGADELLVDEGHLAGDFLRINIDEAQ